MRAPIDRVTVYSAGATVVRVVEVPPGATSVEVPGLPLALDDGTVQAWSSTDGLVTGAVRVGLHAPAPQEVPDPPDEAELRALERRIERAGVLAEQIDAEVQTMRSLRVPDRPDGADGAPPPPSPMRARLALDKLTDDAIRARLAERRTLTAELVRLREQLAALRDQVQRVARARRVDPDAITKVAQIDLAGAAPDGGRVGLSYFIPGARWAPQYRFDVAPDGSTASVGMRALVNQASGEDWRGVRLRLSTAAPTRFAPLPTLASLRIGRTQAPPAAPGFRPPPRGAAALFADFDRDRYTADRMLTLPDRYQGPSLQVDALDLPLQPPVDPPRSVDAARLRDTYADELDEPPMVESAMPPPAAAQAFGAMSAGALPPAPSPSAPAPARRARAAPKRSKKSAAPSHRDLDLDIGAGEAEAQAGPEASAGAGFAQLRLTPPEQKRQGKLVPADRRAERLGRLLALGLPPGADVEALENRALKRTSDAARRPLPSGAVDVRAHAGRFDYAYEADDRVDVPGDGGFHSVPLGTRDAPCELTYVVVPRVDRSVFRVASLQNPEPSPLLEGPADVYVGGVFVVSTTLSTVGPGARFQLGLGVEQGLRCVRNTRFSEERAGTRAVAMAELHHRVAIELHNPLPRAVRVEVRERIPQPATDAEVDVAEVSVEPPWEVWDQVEQGHRLYGGRRWQIEVGAGDVAHLNAHYMVQIYANNEVVGGNRREA